MIEDNFETMKTQLIQELKDVLSVNEAIAKVERLIEDSKEKGEYPRPDLLNIVKKTNNDIVRIYAGCRAFHIGSIQAYLGTKQYDMDEAEEYLADGKRHEAVAMDIYHDVTVWSSLESQAAVRSRFYRLLHREDYGQSLSEYFLDYGKCDDLLHAARYGILEKLASEIANGIDINMRNPDGWFALLMSVYHGQTEAVKFLIGKGADVNQVGRRGNSAIMLAGQGAHQQIKKLLIESGADITAVNMNRNR
jgi:hypothetical protein